MIVTKQYRCIHSSSCVCTKGHLNEDVIFLVFQHLNWNPRLIATLSCVCKWFDEIAKRVLWKEFCRTRAPKMMLDLQSSGSHSVDGNWKALGKLLIYCSGCSKDGLFNSIEIPGHFSYRTRFSRTSGKSFLLPQCRNDVLYVSDPCEHLDQGEEGDVGFFRGVFKSFSLSRVRKMLIDREANFHPREIPRRHLSWSDGTNLDLGNFSQSDFQSLHIQNRLYLPWILVGLNICSCSLADLIIHIHPESGLAAADLIPIRNPDVNPVAEIPLRQENPKNEMAKQNKQDRPTGKTTPGVNQSDSSEISCFIFFSSPIISSSNGNNRSASTLLYSTSPHVLRSIVITTCFC
ncbi:hypothetical protein NE237_021481 [Protea cynaroides]|uniref:F-box protein n=1 Tax=Protea cynaroides TaxID=273540 RepID=A0A9Q0HAC3_9MAGN|nr:hypothetical protein NE237_021481 [Protea cynaroides]